MDFNLSGSEEGPVTGCSEDGHEHSRFSLAELLTVREGLIGLHGVVPLMCFCGWPEDCFDRIFSLLYKRLRFYSVMSKCLNTAVDRLLEIINIIRIVAPFTSDTCT